MEIAWFSMPEESMAKSQQDEDHVNCVVFIGKVLSIMSTPLQAKQLIRSTASMSLSVERCSMMKTASAVGNW